MSNAFSCSYHHFAFLIQKTWHYPHITTFLMTFNISSCEILLAMLTVHLCERTLIMVFLEVLSNGLKPTTHLFAKHDLKLTVLSCFDNSSKERDVSHPLFEHLTLSDFMVRTVFLEIGIICP